MLVEGVKRNPLVGVCEQKDTPSSPMLRAYLASGVIKEATADHTGTPEASDDGEAAAPAKAPAKKTAAKKAAAAPPAEDAPADVSTE